MKYIWILLVVIGCKTAKYEIVKPKYPPIVQTPSGEDPRSDDPSQSDDQTPTQSQTDQTPTQSQTDQTPTQNIDDICFCPYDSWIKCKIKVWKHNWIRCV